jgi:hypothetical protein
LLVGQNVQSWLHKDTPGMARTGSGGGATSPSARPSR